MAIHRVAVAAAHTRSDLSAGEPARREVRERDLSVGGRELLRVVGLQHVELALDDDLRAAVDLLPAAAAVFVNPRLALIRPVLAFRNAALALRSSLHDYLSFLVACRARYRRCRQFSSAQYWLSDRRPVIPNSKRRPQPWQTRNRLRQRAASARYPRILQSAGPAY
jgi:hypothetical protein